MVYAGNGDIFWFIIFVLSDGVIVCLLTLFDFLCDLLDYQSSYVEFDFFTNIPANAKTNNDFWSRLSPVGDRADNYCLP